MIGGDMYEFPDGTVGSNAGDCAQAWADEARRLRAENEALKAMRDHTRACYERSVSVLAGIHALLYPPRFTDNDGRTWQFESPIVEAQMQELSDRIRAIPDELNAIDAALRGEGE